jgi:hypothetical protein
LIIDVGIKQIYEMKLLNYQARKLLVQMCSQVKQMNADYVNDAIFQAIKGGVIEFIDEIVKVDHQLLYTTDTMGRNIFFYAVLYRQAKIFNLIYRLGKAKNSVTNVRDSSKSTILHMAAMLEPSTKRDRIAGDALKMQSEVQWFQVISLGLYFSNVITLISWMLQVILHQMKLLDYKIRQLFHFQIFLFSWIEPIKVHSISKGQN